MILAYNMEPCLAVNGDSGNVAFEDFGAHCSPCVEQRMLYERGPDAFAVAGRIYVQPREFVSCERNKGDNLTFNLCDSKCVVVKALVFSGLFKCQEGGF